MNHNKLEYFVIIVSPNFLLDKWEGNQCLSRFNELWRECHRYSHSQEPQREPGKKNWKHMRGGCKSHLPESSSGLVQLVGKHFEEGYVQECSTSNTLSWVCRFFFSDGIYIESLDLWIMEKLVGRNSIPGEPHCIFLGAGKVVDRREQCLDLEKGN